MGEGVDDARITALEGLEAVRKRPQMYAGRVDDPLVPNFLLKEALCCARDDALLGRCSRVDLRLGSRGVATIRDDGPGLPLTFDSKGIREAERYLTVLFACAAAKQANPESLCTVGLAVLNALSKTMRLRVFQAGAEWSQTYECGIPTSPLSIIGSTAEHGTEFSFGLDDTILRAPEFDVDELVAWANANVERLVVGIHDARTGRDVTIPAGAG
jgi:DNA gyrase subunit B